MNSGMQGALVLGETLVEGVGSGPGPHEAWVEIRRCGVTSNES